MAKIKSGTSWMHKGESGRERIEQQEKEQKQRRASRLVFRQKINTESTVVCIDDALAFLMQHSGKHGDGFFTETCLQDTDVPCPFCQEDVRKSAVYIAGTIINLTGYKNDDGKRIKNFRNILALKGEAHKEMLHQRDKLKKQLVKDGEDGEDVLSYSVWKIRRGSDPKSPGTGVHFEFVKWIEKKDLIAKLKKDGTQIDNMKEFLTPFDYAAVFAPKSEAEARAFLGLSSKKRRDADEDDDEAPEKDDDDRTPEDDMEFD